MSRLLPIDKCTQCHHLHNAYCVHPRTIKEHGEYGKSVYYYHRFGDPLPQWCPLPDLDRVVLL